MKRVAIIAGEASGDAIAEGLVQQIKQHYPDCEVVGMAGSKMIAQGVTPWYHIDDLSVMGVSEVLKALPKILRMRKDLTQRILAFKPDVMIGVDAPDFNLSIEAKLKEQGIKTVHYVSPSIWAWKKGRIHKIKRATDLVLCTLPFEPEIYEAHQHPAVFVGHPLADQMNFTLSKTDYCEQIGLDPRNDYVALLPGSRGFELKRLLPVFLEVAEAFQKRHPDIQFLLPLARASLSEALKPFQAQIETLKIHLVSGQSQAVLGASRVALLASGTVALEAALMNVPSVMAYKLSPLSYWIGKLMIKLPYFSLPNLILNEPLIPEFIQAEASPSHLIAALECQFSKGSGKQEAQVKKLRSLLKKKASEQAFIEISHLLS